MHLNDPRFIRYQLASTKFSLEVISSSKVIKCGNESDKLNIFAESETTKKFSHLVWSSFSESIDIHDVALILMPRIVYLGWI